jgi:hypothetical protein
MATLTGKGHVFGLTGGTLSLKNPDGTTLTGYVSPNLQTLRLVPSAKKDVIPNQGGDTASLIFFDDMLECSFDFVAEGASIANAKSSAGIPQSGGHATITGLAIIKCGAFSDAFNTDAGNTQPWIFEGDASLNIGAEKKLEGSITLRRYPQITTAVAITS